ncbi:MAG: hypothetical protein Q9183_000001 [Haloplaca sp. 2 TL-2023]
MRASVEMDVAMARMRSRFVVVMPETERWSMFRTPLPLRYVLMMACVNRPANTRFANNCHTTPAIIVFVPGARSPSGSEPAAEAIPPPMACMSREKKSIVQKTQSAQGARVRAKEMDDVAKDDVDATCEKCGAEDEGGDLDLECQSAVGTLRGPGSSDPAEEFAEAPKDEDQEPPATRDDGKGDVGSGSSAEEYNEDDASGKGRRVAIVGRIRWIKCGARW